MESANICSLWKFLLDLTEGGSCIFTLRDSLASVREALSVPERINSTLN